MTLNVWRYAYGGAKVMALKSRLLTSEDYYFLLRSRSLDDFLGYLTTTAYGPLLSAWDWQAPDAPKQFTRRLFAELAQAYVTVNRGLKKREQAFVEVLAQRLVSENLKVVLRALHQGTPPPAVEPLLAPLEKLTPLNFQELLQLESIQALADYLGPTSWGPPLARGLPRYLREQNLFPLEMSLDLWVFEAVWEGLHHLSKADRHMAGRILFTLADLTNLTWFARFKEIYHLSGEEIYQYLLEAGSFQKHRLRYALAFAPDLPAMVDGLPPRPYGEALAGTVSLAEIEARLAHYWLKTLEKILCRPPFHLGLPIVYLMLKEMEILDLITLATGIVLKVPADRVSLRLRGRAPGGRHF